MTIQNKYLYLHRINQLKQKQMNYDDWKLQTPPEGKEGLYDGEYRMAISDLRENEDYLISEINWINKELSKVEEGEYFKTQSELLKLEKRKRMLKEFHHYIMEKIEYYQNLLDNN